MKKIVIFSLILAMAAGAAFAQLANGISVNAWGRGAFSPLIVVGDEDLDGKTTDYTGGTYVGTGPTWNGNGIRSDAIRTDFRLHGNSEHVGFTITFTEDGIFRGDDGAQIWAKPFGTDMLKVTVGRFVNDTLRGKVGSVNAGLECFSLPDNNEEDAIFTRFGTTQYAQSLSNLVVPPWAGGDFTSGFMLSSAPIDGLFIGLLVGSQNPLAGDAYRFMQIGAGYEIANIGHIRAQWIGGWFGTYKGDDITKAKGENKYAVGPEDMPYTDGVEPWFSASADPARIEAAFALTSVDNLLLDIGGKFWLPLTDDDNKEKYSKGVDVSLGASYRMDAFNIAARVDAKSIGASFRSVASGADDKSALPMSIDVRLTPAYDFDAATIGLDFGLRIGTASKDGKGDANKDGTTEVGFGLFVKKGFGNGHIKTGATFTLPYSTDGKNGKWDGDSNAMKGSQFVFMIPVVLEYAFF
ncbi:MAG: hypothetical protein LBI06_05085 [Treponema sp.]|jgi:hypothetical protein|nr:hypothetical protein [Treponema sp.]